MSEKPEEPETLSAFVEAHRDELSELVAAPDRRASCPPPPGVEFRADVLLSACIDPPNG
ncbi:hypothetical protein Scel_00270 [Streptomyces cellostaticus]|nr:hypothetical protein Scel_00270 [Streptomyces cellostaticus]